MKLHWLKIISVVTVCLITGDVSYADPHTANQASVAKENLSSSLVKQMQLPNQPDSTKLDPAIEAVTVSNRFQTMSNTIKSQQQAINSFKNVNYSFSTISIVTRLQAIINIIELQCKKLIDMVANDQSATTSPDSEKLNSVMNKLDNQRKSLLNLITTQSQPPLANPTVNPNQLNSIDNTKNANSKFTVFNPDK